MAYLLAGWGEINSRQVIW